MKEHTKMPYVSLICVIMIDPITSARNTDSVTKPTDDVSSRYTSSIQNELVVMRNEPCAMEQKKMAHKMRLICLLNTVLRSPKLAVTSCVRFVKLDAMSLTDFSTDSSCSETGPPTPPLWICTGCAGAWCLKVKPQLRMKA